MQESFRHDPQVQVLLATDAAGEGINLQRAHLMVNYDLPWNPNRLEQRFGRIHRIGQTEVCHLWNLVADETREGDVYRRLLDKLEQARQSLGGQVFDVLGKLEFEGRPLGELLLDAIRYGEQPEVRARLDTAVDQALDRAALQDLLEERQLVHDAMDATRVQRVREEMERAEARRLQPHYIESFFLEAFRQLGGSARQRETRPYQVSHVPALIRNRGRVMGTSEPVLPRYERIVFEKQLVAPPNQPPAAFVCPGHPLLDAVIDLTLERHREPRASPRGRRAHTTWSSAVRTWGAQHAKLWARLAEAGRAVEVVVVGRDPDRLGAAGRMLDKWASKLAAAEAKPEAEAEMAAIRRAIAACDMTGPAGLRRHQRRPEAHGRSGHRRDRPAGGRGGTDLALGAGATAPRGYAGRRPARGREPQRRRSLLPLLDGPRRTRPVHGETGNPTRTVSVPQVSPDCRIRHSVDPAIEERQAAGWSERGGPGQVRKSTQLSAPSR